MSEITPLRGACRRVCRSSWLALALAAPALCLAQQTPQTGIGLPAGELPGAQPPGAVPMASSLYNALELLPLGTQFAHYGASAGVGASDNVNFSADHPKSQALAAASLFFDLLRKGPRLEAFAVGNFSDINYLEHAYSNQVLGRFDGLANATLWEDHLKWVVREDYGDQQINPLQAMTPGNLERVNIFSTGPALTLRPTRTSFVNLRTLYSRSSYQRSPFDAQAETAGVALGHDFSPVSSVSINADVEQLEFDNKTVNRNYQRRSYYGRYQLKGARTAIDLQGGMNQANDLGHWKSSPLVRFSLMRNVSAYSNLTLAAGREYTDAMSGFADLSGGAGGGIPIGAATGTTANAQHTYGNVGWDFHRLRTTLGFFGGWERRTYDTNTGYSVTRENVGVNLGRQLTPRLSATLFGTANRSHYLNQAFTDTSGTLGGGLLYRPGRWVVIYGRYDHQFRRPGGEAARGQGLGFDENRAFIMIGYYPHSSGTGIPGVGGSAGMPAGF